MEALLKRGPTAAMLAAGALVAASLTVVPGTAVQAQPPGCVVVDYQATSWSHTPGSGGFVVHVTITNVCDEPVDGWRLALALPPDQEIAHYWSAIVLIVMDEVHFEPQSWNEVVVPGGTATFGFIGSWLGGYQDPLSCTVDGRPCLGGDNQLPEVTLTSPVDGDVFASELPVPFAAEAFAHDADVDRVEFYVNDVLVATDDTYPYEVEVDLPGPPGVLSTSPDNGAYARVYDTRNPPLIVDSAMAAFVLLPPPPVKFQIVSIPRS